MIARRATETEFKRLTTDEYLQGGYGLDREQAEELAAQEWSIRQEVENHTRVKKVQLKEKNEQRAVKLKAETAYKLECGTVTVREYWRG